MGGSERDVRIRQIVYDPLESQKNFHDCKARYKGYSGPIGSGKSQALCQEAIRLTYLNPHRTGLLGAPTYPMLRDATQATLFEILGANDIPYEHNKAENTLVMKDTGSRILFRPVDDFERLRGTNLAWFGLDELTYTQEEAWLRLEGRLRDPQAERQCGFAAWTPKGYDWVYRKFIARPAPDYQAILATAGENRYLLSRDPDFYARLRHSYDENFYQQEVLGEYLNQNGSLVYHAFERKANIADVKLDPRLPLLWALDFNVDPMSSVVAQIHDGRIEVLDEIILRHATTRQACQAFMERFPKHHAGVRIYGDASGFAQQTSGLSDYDMLEEEFASASQVELKISVPRCNPSVRERINLVNSKLRSASGEISLVIDPKCRELTMDFEQVCYKGDTGQIDKDRDRMRTHASDALGYLAWQECRPLPQIGEQMRRLPGI
ncbi:MAG TPA: phage terminase large subunit [Bryobacteraceae bacterium]|nr:phage terminase large subunit [Bryobacteraceae bacterium]